jgi:hypothetical protein
MSGPYGGGGTTKAKTCRLSQNGPEGRFAVPPPPYGRKVIEATSLQFASAARVLGEAAHRRGLLVPGFRSPPRDPEVDRAIRRGRDGAVAVAVRLRGRPWPAVVADMVEGVVAANRASGAEADGLRRDLWQLLEDCRLLVVDEPPAGRRRLAVVHNHEAA